MEEVATCELPEGQCAFWWLGQQGFIVKLGKTVLCVDAYLSPSPRRQVAPLLSPADLREVHGVLGSHDHLDHIDRRLWPAIAREAPRARFVVPERVREHLVRDLALPVERVWGLDDGRCVEIEEIRIWGVPSAHEFLDADPRTGHFPYLGFIVTGRGCTLYHAGDTCLYEGLHARLRAHRPHVMFLPINGRDARRLRTGCIGNMTYQESADLAGSIQPRLTVPAHFDMFAHNSENPELFRDYMAVKYPDLEVWVPEHGVRRIVMCQPRTMD